MKFFIEKLSDSPWYSMKRIESCCDKIKNIKLDYNIDINCNVSIYTFENIVPIGFCPCCGERTQIIKVKTVTEEVILS